MSGSKPNAYSCFVFDIAAQRRRAGQNVDTRSLFSSLGKEWQDLSEEGKQKYKDMAAKKRQDPFQLPQQNSPLAVCDKKPDISSRQSPNYKYSPQSNYNSNDECKNFVDMKPQPGNIDSKPRIKREHEPGDDDSAQPAQKKPKPNPPNWHKMRGKAGYNPREYRDAHLYELREKSNSIFASKKQDLNTMPLYSFSTNVLCKHKEQGHEVYVPLEIGISAFTIQDGKLLGKPYHVLIDAGPVPTNCYNPASDHAEYHKIPFPPKFKYPSEARNDYRKIYREMIDFTRDGERIILISSARDLNQVKGCIEWIYKKASLQPGKKLPGPGTWTILPVVEYVASMYHFVFKEMLHQPVPPAMHYKLILQLEASAYDYDDTLTCPFHRHPDYTTKWCALSTASRSFLNLRRAFEEIHQNYTKATCTVVPVGVPITMSPSHENQQESEKLQLEDTSNNQVSMSEQLDSGDQTVPALTESEKEESTPALPAPTPLLAIEPPVLLNEAERSQIY